MGNEFKSISSQDGSCTVDVGEYAGEYKVRFRVGGVERGTIDDAGIFAIDNIDCSGTINTIAYQVNTVSVMGGTLVVVRGDSLAVDMTSLDSCTMTIKGNETFAVNDRLQMNNGVANEFFIVTDISSHPTYIVTRDAGGVYASNANPAWPKGTAIANYGPPNTGVVWLSASDVNGPFVSVWTHAGSPWADAEERCRFGNLKGYLGYTVNTYGVGIGSVAAGEASLCFDPTNGIRLRQGVTNIMTIDMSGNAQISGFTISASDGFYAGSGVTRVQMRPGDGFWCGATAQVDAPFSVNAAGDLVATSATVNGQLIAETGSSLPGNYITNNSITGDKIVNATISGTDIASATITSDNITNSTIISTDIADATITGGKIANATITGGKIASATVTSDNITNGTITSTDIANATIIGGKIANGTITGENIANATITGGKIDSGTITGGNIASATVAGSNIINGTITATDIADSTITGGKIDSGTITATNIANSTITGGKIASGTITGGNIANLTITAGLIDNLTITASQIANLTITGGAGGKIATSTITEDNIVANTITAASIAANTVTASQIAADTITANEIVANTITASEISSSTITASELKGTAFGTLTITSGKIAINTTEALEIQSNGSMKMLAGSDVNMYSSAGNFSKIKLYGTTGSHIGDIFAFGSTTCGWYTQESVKSLQLGATNYKWYSASITANTIQFLGYYDADDRTTISLVSGNNNSYISFFNERNGVERIITFNGWYFAPAGFNKTIDLGGSSFAWDDAYADDWHNVADFYNFDIHDDLAAINGIKGSGKFQEHNGHELIDDDTLPPWLLSKHKKDGVYKNEETQETIKEWKKGDAMYDSEGKPYLSLKTCVSLAWGAIRQLDNKFEDYIKGGI